ncbi:MAG: glycosyltransferase [Sphingobacteriaceae bacterium]|nr:glycosyltransferase [Sphingobacteriaceae bacterium]
MIFVVIISFYVVMLLLVMEGFVLHPNDTKCEDQKQKISVVIAARNEEGKIRQCISSIIDQDFPKQLLEIIIVDDASTDNTFKEAAEVLSSSGIEHRLIQNQQHLGKKQSLKLAIEQSNSEILICRDADTVTVSNNWLSSIVNYMTVTKKEFVICPIAIDHKKGILSSLQETEMAILSLFTISSAYFNTPFLANGANLAFTKKLFYATGAYQEHLHIASGDDIFFLEKVKRMDVNKIGYLKNTDAIVYTYPEKRLSGLIHQKIRWSSKLFKNPSVINWLSALIISVSNFAWIGALFYAIFNPQNLPVSLIFILSKLLIDILLVFLASSFIKVKPGALGVAVMALIYPFYASLIAILTVFVKPKWKSN